MITEKTFAVPYVDEEGKNLVGRSPIRVAVPGSKSITNRALLLATLAQGTSTLRGVLFSDDSRHFLQCIQELGFETKVDETKREVQVTGLGGSIPKAEASPYVGSAGTAARFLTALLGVSQGVYHMDASEQMRRRPMAPLIASLRELGCEILCEKEEGFFPFTVRGHGFGKRLITVNIEHSSQFLSALLISSCLCPEDMTIHIEGSHGMAYIEITTQMMEQFGVHVQPQYYCMGSGDNHDCCGCVNSTQPMGYRIAAGQRYRALDYQIEPDVSAACYFYALGALLGVPMQVLQVQRESMQGDMAFLDILVRMGCTLQEDLQGLILLPPQGGRLSGVNADMSACSDQAITLAAIAPYADSPTTITGIGHIRFQECDRLNAIVTELGRMGIRCESTDSSITVYPGAPGPCTVQTYEDHRMAMGFTLTGLKTAGIVIDNPGCCRKTFEEYYETLAECIAQL
ncbi:MAG: 3-phosphoshikimate 1-carboxyvinyltransferase [Acetatifactor sp.]|nr:3-phosphoshikimate 1-carboxyvinyltransferase [Acetatifactor sp.]